MGKIDVARIRSVRPLSDYENAKSDAFVCVVCGSSPRGLLTAYRECNERDLPERGADRVVFLCRSEKCYRVLNAHPRLYNQVTGDPGHFPALCGTCTFREGRSCTHPDLKANGGEGLKIGLGDPFRGAICVLGRNGPLKRVLIASTCAGLEEKT